MKANSTLAVLQTFADAGCGFDIVSGGELERVLAAGGDAGAGRVLRRRQDARRDARARSRPACAASTSRARPSSSCCRRSRVAAGRTRAGQPAREPRRRRQTHPYISTGLKDNKFGIAHDERAARRTARAAALPGIEVVGIDCHIGSQITEVAPYLDALDRVLDLVEAVEARRHRARTTSTSAAASASPTPTRRRPTPTRWSRALLERIDARGHGQREILLEPGRSLVGNAGVLLSEVLYLKPRRAQELLHRRRGDERPGAPGDVRRLDGASCRARARDARAAACTTSSARSASRATGSAATARWRSQPGDLLAVLSAGAYG